jgi:pimeloyl-ACP methyl ester carboxylesterase
LETALLALVLATAACSSGTEPESTPDPVARSIDVGGYRLATRMRGTRTPTVVLLSGLDTPMDAWGEVEVEAGAFARVFAYDRGGVGASEAAPGARTGEAVATELHALLAAAELAPPYVLVAHSFGGIHARVFAGLYPSEIAGLVLVDASHEDQLDLVPPELLPQIAGSLTYDGAKAEMLAQPQSTAQVRAAGVLPQGPLVVLTSMKPEDGETQESKQAWYDLHQQWVDQVPGAVHLTTTSAGHQIPLEEPSLVVGAIRQVTDRVAGATAVVSARDR